MKLKLKDKKTGIIGELYFEPDKEYHFTVVTEDPADAMIYKKLADLYAEWEDYEEPKQHWFIATDGRVLECNEDANWSGEKAIGNYFETKEEAEKAVEKLKAWKRLRDRGFFFKTFYIRDYDDAYESEDIVIRGSLVGDTSAKADEVQKDLDFLFGGEE